MKSNYVVILSIHFMYKKISGDFTLTADFDFTGDTAGAVGHRKIGWMIRESTDEAAAGIVACKHMDGLIEFIHIQICKEKSSMIGV